MNADRRKRIGAIQDQLTEISEALCNLRDEEQEAFDNMPEGLQQSERGQAIEQAAEALDTAQTNVDDAVSELGGIE